MSEESETKDPVKMSKEAETKDLISPEEMIRLNFKATLDWISEVYPKKVPVYVEYYPWHDEHLPKGPGHSGHHLYSDLEDFLKAWEIDLSQIDQSTLDLLEYSFYCYGYVFILCRKDFIELVDRIFENGIGTLYYKYHQIKEPGSTDYLVIEGKLLGRFTSYIRSTLPRCPVIYQSLKLIGIASTDEKHLEAVEIALTQFMKKMGLS